jgi:hypothetical protein
MFIKEPKPSPLLSSDLRTRQVQFIRYNLSAQGFDAVLSDRIAEASTRNLSGTASGKPNTLYVNNIHLVPMDLQWAVIPSDGREILFQHVHYSEALSEARRFAKKKKVKLVLHCCDGWVKDFESFQVNLPYKLISG